MSIQGKPDNLIGNHINFFMNCVHKYTDIYDGTGLLALKGVVVVQRWVLFISISFWIVFTNTDMHDEYRLVGP